jgi:hypothetical protein
MEWISVKEKLPPSGKPILAIGGGYVEVVVYRSPPNSFATHHGGYLRDVTHWMPLPAPPIEQAPETSSALPRSHPHTS